MHILTTQLVIPHTIMWCACVAQTSATEALVGTSHGPQKCNFGLMRFLEG